jgi:hypothetical protein
LQTYASNAKLASMDNDNPPERDVAARIRVRAEHAEDAAAAFDREGLTPIYVEHRADGDVSFWFGKLGMQTCFERARPFHATGMLSKATLP